MSDVLFFAAVIILLPATGFFLTLAFFPKKELGVFEKIVFSAVLGILFPALLLLLENQVFGIPIDFVSSVLTLLLLLAVSIAVFLLRKKRD